MGFWEVWSLAEYLSIIEGLGYGSRNPFYCSNISCNWKAIGIGWVSYMTAFIENSTKTTGPKESDSRKSHPHSDSDHNYEFASICMTFKIIELQKCKFVNWEQILFIKLNFLKSNNHLINSVLYCNKRCYLNS